MSIELFLLFWIVFAIFAWVRSEYMNELQRQQLWRAVEELERRINASNK